MPNAAVKQLPNAVETFEQHGRIEDTEAHRLTKSITSATEDALKTIKANTGPLHLAITLAGLLLKKQTSTQSTVSGALRSAHAVVSPPGGTPEGLGMIPKSRLA